jgi:hypothetical protein
VHQHHLPLPTQSSTYLRVRVIPCGGMKEEELKDEGERRKVGEEATNATVQDLDVSQLSMVERLRREK